MILAIHALAHFLVDGLCVSTLFSAGLDGKALSAAVILYNSVAFSTQCLVGLWLDRRGHWLRYDAGAMLLVVLGFLLPIPALLRVCLCAAGNSVFHVAAGAMTLSAGRGRTRDLGIFVAPGAFGVTLATCFPGCGRYLLPALLLCIAAACYVWPRTPATLEFRPELDQPAERFPAGPVLLLTAAVAVRAIGGAAVQYAWKTGVTEAFLLTAFVFAGKLLGGWICDRLGPAKTGWISILPAAVCIALFSDFAVPALAGQFLLNLTMPVTLWLLYRALPGEPAFAFGLAASALWPGTIAGLLLPVSGAAGSCCMTVSFAFGLFAILYAAKKLGLLKGAHKK